MKCNIQTPPADFKPIDILITIESRRELEFLYALFGNAYNDLAKLANKCSADSGVSQFDGKELATLHTDLKPLFNLRDHKL